MSDYCHRKVIRMKISEEEACKIFGVDDGWGVSDLLEKTEFEIAPTSDSFLTMFYLPEMMSRAIGVGQENFIHLNI